MQAIVQDRYGSPEHLRLAEVDTPVLEDDRALVRVHAASLNSGDWRRVRADPFIIRLVEGVRRPKSPLFGVDAAGVVEAVGKDVTDLHPGDEVMGFRKGAFAEYVCGRMFVPKPANLTFEQAAAVPVAGGTALVALRDKGQLQPGQRVLINGAGGGVGTFAVQIAKALGGVVTAVTSTAHLELVQAIGADHAIDYTRQDFTRSGERYDLIVDIGGTPSMGALRRALTPEGTLVIVAASKGVFGPLGGFAAAWFRSRVLKQRVISFIADLGKEHLLTLKEMIENGEVTPVIDRTYPLSETPAAIAYVEHEQARGKVIIAVS